MADITLPRIDDFHTHLRQGAMMKLVTPMLESGGVRTAYVMPNLKPPISSTEQAMAYKAELQKLAPSVNFLMTLYLGPELTPDEIRKAAAAGVKDLLPCFSSHGEVGMILNLHGEIPSDPENDVCVLNAEERFLWMPITIHHLTLIVDDWAGQCHNFCKPVAKFPHDREALRNVVLEGDCLPPRFFLGTDSAPHPRHTKETAVGAAGVFTGFQTTSFLAHVLDSFGALGSLKTFACENGRKFYVEFGVPKELTFTDDDGSARAVVPFMAGKPLAFSLVL
ncbi:hypothetical protein BC829DRAFT_401284 [Chytridium lagenaria]|nr:hypothetical protein BC829DRAFT_401284 [Chytridium lagenaria]